MAVENKGKRLKQVQLSFFPKLKPSKPKVVVTDHSETVENESANNNESDKIVIAKQLNGFGDQKVNGNDSSPNKEEGKGAIDKENELPQKLRKKAKKAKVLLKRINLNSVKNTDSVIVLSDTEENEDIDKTQRKRQRSGENINNEQSSSNSLPTNPIILVNSPTPVKKRKEEKNDASLKPQSLKKKPKLKNAKSSSAVKNSKPSTLAAESLGAVKAKKRSRSASPKAKRELCENDTKKETSKTNDETTNCITEIESIATPSKKLKPSADSSSSLDSVKSVNLDTSQPSKCGNVDKSTELNDSSLSVASTSSNVADENKKSTKPSSAKKKKISSEVAAKRKAEQERKNQEREEKRLAKEKERLAREKEKEEKAKEKLEQKLKRDELRRQKKELDEKIKLEKLKILEEQKLKKQEELLAKQKERAQKELERKLEKEKREEIKRKKEDEKRAKEQEKLREQEEKEKELECKKQKEQKQANSFKNFFKSPSRPNASPKVKSQMIGPFNNFQLKMDMSMAPIIRRVLVLQEKNALLDKIAKQDYTGDYIKNVKFGKRIRKSEPTIPHSRIKLLSLCDDGLEVINDDEKHRQVPKDAVLKAKLLKFHNNYRPPYYGTWRKKSKTLCARNPFKKDEKILDYEFDSDDEWEDPGEGEDIAESDAEEEEKDVNDNDENDGFFVPHGYLSDDEGIEDDGDQTASPVSHKMKQKQQEFEATFKRKIKHLKPVIIGPVWTNSPDYCIHQESLMIHKIQSISAFPLNVDDIDESSTDSGISVDTSQAKQPKIIPEEAIPELIRVLHGNPIKLRRIVDEFYEYWTKKMDGTLPDGVGPINLDDTVANSQTGSEKDEKVSVNFSKALLQRKCREISSHIRIKNWSRTCWVVNDEVLKKYNLDDGRAPIPTKWKFLTENVDLSKLYYITPKPVAPLTAAPAEEEVKAPSLVPQIMKFVKKISPEDILQSSKEKHVKELEITRNKIAANISKYACDKLNPADLIQKSCEKLDTEREKLAKQFSLPDSHTEKDIPPITEECKYGLPTTDAVRTFFKIQENSENTAKPTSETPNED